jgi:methionyl-tRNA synthetase
MKMVDLEEHSVEQAGDRCEECGAKLSEQELRAVLESGSPALCSVHAAESLALDPTEAEGPAEES